MTPLAEPSPSIIRFAAVESTQVVAFQLAAEGAADRTVVVADHQSAGRGRRGHAWTETPGTSLLASILVRPRVAPSLWPAFSLTTAVAVAEALRKLAGIGARLKWPNDVLVGGRKIAGILVESRAAAEPLLIVGIGINLAQRQFPPELGDRATSVTLETGRTVGSDATLEALLEGFDAWRGRLEDAGFAPVRERWLALADTIGQTVTVDAVTGVAVDLASDGALLVDDGAGVRRIVAGEIAVSGAPAAGGGRMGHAARR